jgi:hypothetical protein
VTHTLAGLADAAFRAWSRDAVTFADRRVKQVIGRYPRHFGVLGPAVYGTAATHPIFRKYPLNPHYGIPMIVKTFRIVKTFLRDNPKRSSQS